MEGQIRLKDFGPRVDSRADNQVWFEIWNLKLILKIMKLIF